MLPMPSIGAAARARRAALGGDPAAQAFGLGEDPAEVVGRQAGDELAVPDRCCEPAADLGQRAVAREAAVLGVDLLEVVDVDQDERERALVALCAPCFRAQLLVEGAVVGQVRQLVACGERTELGARVGEADGRLRGEGERRESVRCRRLRRRARPRAERRRGSAPRSGRGPPGPEDHRGRLVPFASDTVVPGTSRAEPRGSQAPTIVPKPPVSKRMTAAASTCRSNATSSATIENSSTGSGSSATASWMRCSAVLTVNGRRVAEDGDDACDEAELVAARRGAAFEDDVAAVLAGIALRAVRGREQVSGCMSE